MTYNTEKRLIPHKRKKPIMLFNSHHHNIAHPKFGYKAGRCQIFQETTEHHFS